MPVLADVERVPVVGAQAHVGRRYLGQQGRQRVQVLRHGPLADQNAQALLQLLARLGLGRGLVLGPDAGRDIGVEVATRQQRRVAVDVPTFKETQLGHRARIAMEHAGIVHEFGQPQPGRIPHQVREIIGRQRGAGGLHVRGRHAGRQLHLEVHQQVRRGALEVADALGAHDVRDLVRVADRGGHAARRHAAVELERRDKRAFDVQVRVDEAGHQDQPGHVDHLCGVVRIAGADDAVTDDRHVALEQRAGHQVEHAAAAQHDVGRRLAARRRDAFLQGVHALCPAFFRAQHGMARAARRGGRRPSVANPPAGAIVTRNNKPTERTTRCCD